MKARYKGGWKYVNDDCQLCEMQKRTEWYLETKDFIICEKLHGGAMIVSKWHEKQLSDDRRERAERIVSLLYDEFELKVLMDEVKNHWHGHIITGEKQ